MTAPQENPQTTAAPTPANPAEEKMLLSLRKGTIASLLNLLNQLPNGSGSYPIYMEIQEEVVKQQGLPPAPPAGGAVAPIPENRAQRRAAGKKKA